MPMTEKKRFNVSDTSLNKIFCSEQDHVKQTADNARALQDALVDDFRAVCMLHAYETRGYRVARLKPWSENNMQDENSLSLPQDLQITHFGFTEADLNRKIQLRSIPTLGGFLAEEMTLTLREFLQKLRQMYCQSVGYEYMHITENKVTHWIRSRIKAGIFLKPNEQETCLWNLAHTAALERLLHTKFKALTRHTLAGFEGINAVFKILIQHATERGVKEILFGFSHRSCLNILAQVLCSDPTAALKQLLDWEINKNPGFVTQEVKVDRVSDEPHNVSEQKFVRLTFFPNEGHEESVNPVVLGYARAKQQYLRDEDKANTLVVFLHEAENFRSQGINYETIQLSDLRYHSVYGSIHIVLNELELRPDSSNGFSQFSNYTGLGRIIQAPIFHVGGDDPEAALAVTKFAVDYRNTFNHDVFIDIVCFKETKNTMSSKHTPIQSPSRQQKTLHADMLAFYTARLKKEVLLPEKNVSSIAEIYHEGLAS